MGTGVGPTVRVYRDLPAASTALARHLRRAANRAFAERGRFTWVLSGGSTPLGLYRELARPGQGAFPWRETEVFFGDERCVPPADPESNYRTVRETLLEHVPANPRRVHRMPGEVRPPSEAARRYARTIARGSGPPGSPRFDLVLLGLGPDGHTASLFPGAASLEERRRTVVAVPASPLPPQVPRLTMTLPALGSSREICFLVSGPEKASAVGRTFLALPTGRPELPASLVWSDGPVTWFLDRDAAASLPNGRVTAGRLRRGRVPASASRAEVPR